MKEAAIGRVDKRAARLVALSLAVDALAAGAAAGMAHATASSDAGSSTCIVSQDIFTPFSGAPVPGRSGDISIGNPAGINFKSLGDNV